MPDQDHNSSWDEDCEQLAIRFEGKRVQNDALESLLDSLHQKREDVDTMQTKFKELWALTSLGDLPPKTNLTFLRRMLNEEVREYRCSNVTH